MCWVFASGVVLDKGLDSVKSKQNVYMEFRFWLSGIWSFIYFSKGKINTGVSTVFLIDDSYYLWLFAVLYRSTPWRNMLPGFWFQSPEPSIKLQNGHKMSLEQNKTLASLRSPTPFGIMNNSCPEPDICSSGSNRFLLCYVVIF